MSYSPLRCFVRQEDEGDDDFEPPAVDEEEECEEAGVRRRNIQARELNDLLQDAYKQVLAPNRRGTRTYAFMGAIYASELTHHGRGPRAEGFCRPVICITYHAVKLSGIEIAPRDGARLVHWGVIVKVVFA